MRIIKKEISGKNGSGFVRLQADDPEDMWHLYNLISENDIIVSPTVVKESATGSTSKNRKKITIKLRIEGIEFDSEQCSLRVRGKNIEENEFIRMGQYHTIDIEVSQPFRLEKPCWDAIYLDRLDEASDPGSKADIGAIVMQDGLAHVCLVTQTMTVTRARLERRIPKKNQYNQEYDRAMEKFFDDIYEAIRKHFNFDIIKVVLIGSPGFLKDDFMDYYATTATNRSDSVLLANKSKFVKSTASSGHKNAVEQLLSNNEVRGQLTDVKAAAEVKALERFYQMLSNNEDRATYGLQHVLAADEYLAVDELLITDKLFKSGDAMVRKQYVDLVESVREHGGKVFVLSSMHVSGEQLQQYTGIAATLRFPLQKEQEYNDGDSSSDSSEDNTMRMSEDDLMGFAIDMS